MIKLIKGDCPDSLDTSVNSKGKKETEEAISFYSDEQNKEKAFLRRKVYKPAEFTKESYKEYKNTDVKKQLSIDSNKKCSYCESKMAAVMPQEIEHFRPKAGVIINDNFTRPGYFWLAADWNNLIRSCKFCNAGHTHYNVDYGIEKVQGKDNQFPLVSDSKRMSREDGLIFFSNTSQYDKKFKEEEESRLLINPFEDEAETYFKYESDGRIIPNPEKSQNEINQAKSSIEVYALQRKDLVDSRKEIILKVEQQIIRVQEIIEDLNDLSEHDMKKKDKLEDRLLRELKTLKEFGEPKSPYSGLGKLLIDEVDEDIKAYFSSFNLP